MNGEDHLVRYLGPARLLTAAQREQIAAGLTTALPNHGIAHYLQAKSHMLAEPDHMAAAYDAEGCVAMAAASERNADGTRFTYIETLLVAERLHRTPLALALVSTLMGGVVEAQGGFPDIVAMKTYNPRAYTMMGRFAQDDEVAFYPSIRGTYANPGEYGLTRLAGSLARALSPECDFEPGSGIVRGGAGAIDGGFWPGAPTCGHPVVDRFFAERMTPADRLLCLIGADGEVAKRSVLRRLGLPDATASLSGAAGSHRS